MGKEAEEELARLTASRGQPRGSYRTRGQVTEERKSKTAEEEKESSDRTEKKSSRLRSRARFNLPRRDKDDKDSNEVRNTPKPTGNRFGGGGRLRSRILSSIDPRAKADIEPITESTVGDVKGFQIRVIDPSDTVTTTSTTASHFSPTVPTTHNPLADVFSIVRTEKTHSQKETHAPQNNSKTSTEEKNVSKDFARRLESPGRLG